MRIIAGKFKGISLFRTSDKKIRPLKDMVKESIFNFLNHSNKISFELKKSNVLDLYSGTGSFGLECISRQADKVTFVEKQKEAIQILEKNIEKIKAKKNTRVFYDDVFNLIMKEKNGLSILSDNLKNDLIFCDPPFKDTNINNLIELIIKKNLLKEDGIIILHRHKNSSEKLTPYFKVIEQRIYGISKIIYGKYLSPLT